MSDLNDQHGVLSEIASSIERIADALDRAYPPPPPRARPEAFAAPACALCWQAVGVITNEAGTPFPAPHYTSGGLRCPGVYQPARRPDGSPIH